MQSLPADVVAKLFKRRKSSRSKVLLIHRTSSYPSQSREYRSCFIDGFSAWNVSFAYSDEVDNGGHDHIQAIFLVLWYECDVVSLSPSFLETQIDACVVITVGVVTQQ